MIRPENLQCTEPNIPLLAYNVRAVFQQMTTNSADEKPHRKKVPMMPKPMKGHFIRVLFTTFILFTATLSSTVSAASANIFTDIYSGWERVSELPGEVNALQESYQQTLNQLNETSAQLGQAQANVEAFKAQNEQLIEQNQKLTDMVTKLQEDQDAKNATTKRIQTMIITVIVLILGYFVLIRVMRWGMRRRSGRA